MYTQEAIFCRTRRYSTYAKLRLPSKLGLLGFGQRAVETIPQSQKPKAQKRQSFFFEWDFKAQSLIILSPSLKKNTATVCPASPAYHTKLAWTCDALLHTLYGSCVAPSQTKKKQQFSVKTLRSIFSSEIGRIIHRILKCLQLFQYSSSNKPPNGYSSPNQLKSTTPIRRLFTACPPARLPAPPHRYAGHYGAAREKSTDSKEHRRTHRQRQTKRDKIYMCLFSGPPTIPRNERNSNTATTERTHDATAHQRAPHREYPPFSLPPSDSPGQGAGSGGGA